MVENQESDNFVIRNLILLRNLRNTLKHTFTENNDDKCKCDECEFGGANRETMKVHLGKYHMGNFEFGLCEYKVESLEHLNLHLNTCEFYRCRRYQLKETNITDI